MMLTGKRICAKRSVDVGTEKSNTETTVPNLRQEFPVTRDGLIYVGFQLSLQAAPVMGKSV